MEDFEFRFPAKTEADVDVGVGVVPPVPHLLSDCVVRPSLYLQFLSHLQATARGHSKFLSMVSSHGSLLLVWFGLEVDFFLHVDFSVHITLILSQAAQLCIYVCVGKSVVLNLLEGPD